MQNILPNLNIAPITYPDGSFRHYEISVISDEYVIRDKSCDIIENDIVEPYYTYGSVSVTNENYDWEENPRGFEAVLLSTLPPDVFIA